MKARFITSHLKSVGGIYNQCSKQIPGLTLTIEFETTYDCDLLHKQSQEPASDELNQPPIQSLTTNYICVGL